MQNFACVKNLRISFSVFCANVLKIGVLKGMWISIRERGQGGGGGGGRMKTSIYRGIMYRK